MFRIGKDGRAAQNKIQGTPWKECVSLESACGDPRFKSISKLDERYESRVGLGIREREREREKKKNEVIVGAKEGVCQFILSVVSADEQAHPRRPSTTPCPLWARLRLPLQFLALSMGRHLLTKVFTAPRFLGGPERQTASFEERARRQSMSWSRTSIWASTSPHLVTVLNALLAPHDNASPCRYSNPASSRATR